MEIELVEDDAKQEKKEAGSSATVVCTPSTRSYDKINELLQGVEIKDVLANDGVEVFQRYVQQSPPLIIIDHDLPKLSSCELLNQIARINSSNKQVTKILMICNEISKDHIVSIMKPVKISKGSLKLGLLISPWNALDFYRQLTNHFPENEKLKSRVDVSLARIRVKERAELIKSKLFLGVEEIGQGLRVELGNDRVISAASDTPDDYTKKIEKALVSCSVEYIQFSLEETTAMLPANVIAMMMLMNGFANKHNKEILFVSIPSGVKSHIEKYGLGELLPLEHDVDLF